jgi:hypothetical protein
MEEQIKDLQREIDELRLTVRIHQGYIELLQKWVSLQVEINKKQQEFDETIKKLIK